MEKYTYGVKGEEHVLKKLSRYSLFNGIEKVNASGSQFYAKEDLISEKFIFQVKTTEKKKYRVSHKDYALLDSWGIRQNLIPIFVIYFEVYDTIKILFDLDCSVFIKNNLITYRPDTIIGLVNSPVSYDKHDYMFRLKEYILYVTDEQNIIN